MNKQKAINIKNRLENLSKAKEFNIDSDVCNLIAKNIIQDLKSLLIKDDVLDTKEVIDFTTITKLRIGHTFDPLKGISYNVNYKDIIISFF